MEEWVGSVLVLPVAADHAVRGHPVLYSAVLGVLVSWGWAANYGYRVSIIGFHTDYSTH